MRRVFELHRFAARCLPFLLASLPPFPPSISAQIALSSQPISGKLPVAHYASSISTLTKPGGTFLITSCNFTSAELISRFDSAGFDVREILPVPTFTFGGAKGSTTTSIAFLRR